MSEGVRAVLRVCVQCEGVGCVCSVREYSLLPILDHGGWLPWIQGHLGTCL